MNVVSITGISTISILTGVCLYLLHRWKNRLTPLSGTVAALVITVMGGLLAGYITGILSASLFLPVGLGTLIGFILGCMAGQPVGIIAVLISSVFGLMSGIIGALLGAILQFDNPYILLGIFLGLYVVIINLVILFMKVETNKKASIDTKTISPFNILSVGLILAALFLFLYSSNLVKIPGQSEDANVSSSTVAETTELDVSNDDDPKIKMTITPAGYSPNVIRVKKGVPVELEITNPDDNSCFSTFMMPDFNLNNVPIKVGTNKLNFTPDKTGHFTFSCGMNMYKGTVIVE